MRILVLSAALLSPLAAIPFLAAQNSGGVQTHIVGIEVPSVPNAPFTAKDFVTWTEPLPGGGTIATKYYTVIARDSAGRVRRETRQRVPENSDADSRLITFFVNDPTTHIRINCTVATRICDVVDFRPVLRIVEPRPGHLPGDRFLTRENLGQQDFLGLPATGTRDTITTAPNANGNSGVLIQSTEMWLSPALGMYLSVKRNEPQFGQLTLTIGDLVRGEPDASLMSVPSGYKIVDARASAALH